MEGQEGGHQGRLSRRMWAGREQPEALFAGLGRRRAGRRSNRAAYVKPAGLEFASAYAA